MRTFLSFLTWGFLLSPGVFVSAQDNYLSFDGVDDKVSFNQDNFPTGSMARTIEAWVNTTQNAGDYMVILSYGNVANNNRFTVQVDPATTPVRVKVDIFGAYQTFDAVHVNDGGWHHIAVSYGQGEQIGDVKVYMDGIPLTVKPFAISPFVVPNTSGNIGSIGGILNVQHFDGLIDEIKVWDKALTNEEVVQSMCSEAAGTEPNLIAYFNFNDGECGGDNTLLAEPSLSELVASNNGTLENFDKTGCSSNYVCGGPTCNLPYLQSNLASGLQIENGDVFITDLTKGIIMKDANGNCWKYRPNLLGQLSGNLIKCPK